MSTEEMTSRDYALIAARAADKRKATDIMIINVGALIDVTEYFVIATAANSPQVEAVLETIEEDLRNEAGIKPFAREVTRDHTWELLDYGDFVVNVFQPEAREFYRLESLWSDAPIIDIEEAGVEFAEYSERIAKMLGRSQQEQD